MVEYFKINTQRLPNGIVAISIKGFLDAHTYHELDQTIKNLFSRKSYRLIVDLSQVHYIGSSGIGVFIGAIGTAWENDGDIAIATRPRSNAKEVFDLLGLSRVFVIADNMGSALNTFRYRTGSL